MGQLWCNTNHPYFVIGWSSHSYWWLSRSQCNDRCQHFKNSRTVEAPQLQFLINSLAFSRIVSDTSMSICQAVGSGFCCIRSSSCLAAGCLLAKLGLRTMLEDHLPFVASARHVATHFHLVLCRDTLGKTQCCGSHPCGPTGDRHLSVSSGVRYA